MGAVVYLNGKELFRTANLPAAPVLITSTHADHGQSVEDAIDNVILSASTVVEGSNVLAVEIHQQAPDSSDLSFNLDLVGLPVIIRNAAPTIVLTNPPNLATFQAPLLIPLRADASDTDGTVTKVEFFAGGLKLGEDTNAPFGFDWNNPPLGPHALTALATDDQDATRRSAAVNIIVYDQAGTPCSNAASVWLRSITAEGIAMRPAASLATRRPSTTGTSALWTAMRWSAAPPVSE